MGKVPLAGKIGSNEFPVITTLWHGQMNRCQLIQKYLQTSDTTLLMVVNPMWLLKATEQKDSPVAKNLKQKKVSTLVLSTCFATVFSGSVLPHISFTLKRMKTEQLHLHHLHSLQPNMQSADHQTCPSYNSQMQKLEEAFKRGQTN